MTYHITSPDQLDSIADAMQAQMVKDAETRLRLAKTIRFRHGVGVGSRVFIAWRRASVDGGPNPRLSGGKRSDGLKWRLRPEGMDKIAGVTGIALVDTVYPPG